MEVRIENLTKAFTSQKGPEVIAVNNMSFVILMENSLDY